MTSDDKCWQMMTKGAKYEFVLQWSKVCVLANDYASLEKVLCRHALGPGQQCCCKTPLPRGRVWVEYLGVHL